MDFNNRESVVACVMAYAFCLFFWRALLVFGSREIGGHFDPQANTARQIERDGGLSRKRRRGGVRHLDRNKRRASRSTGTLPPYLTPPLIKRSRRATFSLAKLGNGQP